MAPRPSDFDDNQSAWREGAAPRIPEAPLKGEQRADAVIIGGGFTGVSTALHLSERYPDRRILLLEARELANGASGRSGGQLLHWINGVHFDDPELVRRTYAATDQGIRSVIDTIRARDLAVRYRFEGTFELYTDTKRAEEGQAHVERVRAMGIDLRWMDAAALRDHVHMQGVLGGIYDPHTGLINGVDYIRALAPVLLARGVGIHEGTLVTGIDEGREITVRCAQGEVRTPAVFLATNAYTGKLGYFADRLFPLHSHMVATAPQPEERWRGLGWRPGHAFADDLDRIAFGGIEAGGRMVFGGGSNASYTYGYGGPTALDSAQHAAGYAAVEARMHGYLPDCEGMPITHRWSGPLAITLNRQPAIGVGGMHGNVYYAYGYSGHGVALSNLAGRVLCDLYSGDHDAWKDQPFYQNRLHWLPPEPLRWVGYKVVTGLTGKSPRRH